jgi:transcriptional regulator with XRE-family HTH domain
MVGGGTDWHRFQAAMVTRADDDFYDVLGARVRRFREERGWTQEELAQAIAIEPATLSRYETAKQAFPLEVLRRIATSLRLPLIHLIAEPQAGTAAPKLADAPVFDRHAELIELWRQIPPPRRKLALRILRAFVGEG